MRTDLFKFAAVGILNTAIDFLLLNLFVRLGLSIFWAIFFAYLLGAVNGYVLNNSWTYGHLGKRTTLFGYLSYAGISFVGMGLTEAVIYLLANVAHTELNVNKLVAVVVVFAWNFLSNRLITFRSATATIIE